MNAAHRIDGIALYSDGPLLLRSLGRRIDVSTDNGLSFQRIGKLELGPLRNLSSINPLARRLLRSNVKHCIRLSGEQFLLFAAQGIHRLDLADQTLRQVASVTGSSPLGVAFDGTSVFYGEYRNNADRSPIRVWRSDDEGERWHTVHTFTGVRHVHSIAVDPHDGALWLTTGDDDHESALWRTDTAFSNLQKVLSGSQQCRAIHTLFTPTEVLFGTDAPDEPNRVYALRRGSVQPRVLGPVCGPVFHARTVGDEHWFSTACEPSEVNSLTQMDVYRFTNGQFTRVAGFRKDRWDMRFFQYGQVSFADGPGPGRGIWASLLASERDQTSLWLGDESAQNLSG